jgi:FtsP/CotA-like multicopper oxidase with cupredoxin domain
LEFTVGSAIMRTRKLTPEVGAAVLTLFMVAVPGNASAADYYLKAVATTITDPNGGPAIPVWGYASCVAAFASCGLPTVPGPALTLAAGDTVLNIHLLNGLPAPAPTSIVVNGLSKAMAPVWTTDDQGRRRVRSFDAEANPGGTADYSWTNVKPGTYLYQSGTQPQVQVQMGLYGALSKNGVDADPLATTPVRAQAYAGATYDNQATLLYSEIDPALHAAVANGTYGTTGPTSTFNYDPKYFLINGAPYQYGTTPTIQPAGSTGTTLLRLLNAGLMTHVPSIQGKYWDVIAEDGKPYSYKQNQYTALLTAAKTLDVLLTPDIGGAVYPILDRRLSLSNAGTPNGGMMAFLQYGATGVVGGPPGDTNLPPVANPDSYSSIAGTDLSVGVAQGVLVNDSDPDGLPQPIKAVSSSGPTTAGGSYVLNANGSFIYTPPGTITGPTADTFAYSVTDGKALSAPATVTINLAVPVAPALTLLDNFNRVDSTTATGLGADWGQTASSTSPANVKVQANQAFAAAIDLGGQAIWIKDTDPGPADTSVLGASQYAAFSSAALADSALILKATGGTLKEAPANFVRVRMEGANIVVATQVGGSNAAVYAKQASFPAGASAGTLSAMVDGKGLVTVFLNGVFKGGVQLPDVGVWKGAGRIGIQVQTLNASIDDFSGGTLP